MPTTADRQTRQPALDTPQALSGSWLVDPEASHARFLAGALAGLATTEGRFRSLSGHLVVGQDHVGGALVIIASSIETGNRLRDRHLRSRGFFNVNRHPQLRYEAHSITGDDPGGVRIDGDLFVADACTPLSLDVTLDEPADGVVELACQTEVDRVALGIRGARGMVPRAVQLEVAITLRRTIA
ncbi:MAG: hypothetical protein QOI10_1640 [Solirubrobacterales bacterium]|jgi:polyisoprenoid-binding protein YceI|nr:hypothetical protein [Solirubrobacterales bacterium]